MYAINFSGAAAIPGPYDDMTNAAANGVQLGKPFYTGAGGIIYGYTPGQVIVRTT